MRLRHYRYLLLWIANTIPQKDQGEIIGEKLSRTSKDGVIIITAERNIIIVKVNNVQLTRRRIMEDATTIALDSTVRSQNSSYSKESKDSVNSESKPESCLESKHSKDVLIPEKQQRQHQHPKRASEDRQDPQAISEAKDDSNLLMFTSCGQLLLGKL